MKDIRTRDQFESALNALVGLELAGVKYFEIEYEIQEPCYLHHASIGHFLDFGLELRMASGRYCSFLWDQTFWQYGVGLFPNEAKLELGASRHWDVTSTPEWRPFVGSSIEAARVYWSWPEPLTAKEMHRTYYPQDLALSFAAGEPVYISSSRYSDASDTLYGMSDDILVVFDETVARRYGVGPHAATE